MSDINTVKRGGHTRKDSTSVEATIFRYRRDRGETKQFKALGGPRYIKKTARERHDFLRESVRTSGYRSTVARLSAVRGHLREMMSERDRLIFDRDRRWLKKQFGTPKKATGRNKKKG